MKQIILKRIRLTDWRAKNLDVSFKEGATKINAKNEVGKSSLQYAWNWVLTGYTTPTAPRNADLFDNRVELTPDTPEATVKVWIAVDGIDYTIERIAKAKFKRPRGQAEYVKDASDEYTIKVDDIEMNATAFNEWVSEVIAPIGVLLYALDGAFFSMLTLADKNKARAVLEKMVGSISLSDYKGDYSLIEDKLLRYTPEQIKEQSASQLKPVKKRFDDIPAVIESKNDFISSYKATDWGAIEQAIKDVKTDIEKIDSTMLDMSERYSPILNEMSAISGKIFEEKEKMRLEREAIISDIQKRLLDIDATNSKILRDNAFNECSLLVCKNLIDKNNLKISKLKGERATIEKSLDLIETSSSSIMCPTCGQPMPQDVVVRNNENTRAGLISDIDSINKEISKLESIIADCRKDISTGKFAPRDLVSTTDLQMSLASYSEPINFNDNPEIRALTEKLNSLNTKAMDFSSEYDIEDLKLQKGALLKQLEAKSRDLGIRDKIDAIHDEINALKAERRALACEMAHLEGIQSKCQEFIEERANIISDRINHMVEGCKVRMFNVQKNGERTPDCALTDSCGVNYAALSTSAKIRTHIGIQQLFRKFYKVDMMTWVDEAAVFDSASLPIPNGQVCYLFASDSPTLVVE